MDQDPAPNPQGYEQPVEYRQPHMYEQPVENGHPEQSNIITTQGNVAYVSPNTVVVTSGLRPPNETVLATLVWIFCFWPTGIYAIKYAIEANNELINNVAWRKYRTSMRLIVVIIILEIIGIAISIWRIVKDMPDPNS